MLQSLFIKNYALIDSVELNFNDGFTAITGETGTGKSIILGALSLVLGERADTSVLFDKDKKCVIESKFILEDPSINKFLEDNNLDSNTDSSVIIRREISAKGNSRIFINDTPVQLNILRQFSKFLLDLNTQYQKFSLSDSANQLNYLDLYSNNSKLLDKYEKVYNNYKTINQNIEKAKSKLSKLQTEEDYYKFLNKELEDANLYKNEDVDIEEELKVLENVDNIKTKLSTSLEILSENEQYNCKLLIHDVCNYIDDIADYLPKEDKIAERLNNIYYELEDIILELDKLNSNIVPDDSRIEYLNERLNYINILLAKHKVANVNDLLQVSNDISSKIDEINNLSLEIETLNKQLAESFNTVKTIGLELSSIRKKQAEKLSKKVSDVLKELGIPFAQFKVVVEEDTTNFTETGCNTTNFLFTANKGSNLLPLMSVASGGELSRVMLALKSVIIKQKTIPTVVFDEIDSGISGLAATKVASKLKEISENKMQVITITHLPQIAAKADHQFLVYKESTDKRTYTKVQKLDYNSRVDVIAGMISGDKITAEAKENAKQLLNI